MEIRIENQVAEVTPELVKKYAVAAPRYTSYPTCPNWDRSWSADNYRRELERSNETRRPLSLYFHIPFCEERCTFCACSTIATKKHEVAERYLASLLREMEVTSGIVDGGRPVTQIHLGGGTPTYLSPTQIERLFEALRFFFPVSPSAEISVEIDPRVTTADHLQTLKKVGVGRLSLGLQDFDERVQKAIGRIQSFEQTESVIRQARSAAFGGINCDLVYGLPGQTVESFRRTLELTVRLKPDRLSLFHFAHVPWLMPHQSAIDASTLPSSWQKLELFGEAIRILEGAGFVFIGLDHFARRDDALTKAFLSGDLDRNFQGYSTHSGCDLIGLGITSISQLRDSYSQNVKRLKDYETILAEGSLPARSGMVLGEDDLIRQWVINELFCHLKIGKEAFYWRYHLPFDISFHDEKKSFEALEQDGLIRNEKQEFAVTPTGRFFLRNIAMAFDRYARSSDTKRYSRVL